MKKILALKHYGWYYQIWQSVDRIVMLPDAANWHRDYEKTANLSRRVFVPFFSFFLSTIGLNEYNCFKKKVKAKSSINYTLLESGTLEDGKRNKSDEQNQIHCTFTAFQTKLKSADTYPLSLLYLSFHRDQRSK